jgi:hypothetical protein
MRAFGLARLAADDAAMCRERLTDFLIALFEQAEIERRTASTSSWIEKYGQELDNLRAALTWAFGPPGDPRKGIRLISRSSEIWSDFSLVRERRRWLDLAAAHLDDEIPPEIRGRILYAGIPALYARRELPANLLAAIALLRQTEDRLGLALALRIAAMASARDGDVADGEAYLREAEALARPFGLTRALLLLLTTKATLRKMAGDFSGARQSHAECLVLSRSLGNPLTIAATEINLAELDFAEGDIAAAVAGAREACALSRRTGMLQNLSDALQNLAAYCLSEGNVAEGREAALEAIDLKRSLDTQPWLIPSLEHLALAAALDGDLETAGRLGGYTDHRIRVDSGGRETTEQIGWMNLTQLLEAGLSREDRARLAAEGQAWSEDVAIMAARGELTL